MKYESIRYSIPPKSIRCSSERLKGLCVRGGASAGCRRCSICTVQTAWLHELCFSLFPKSLFPSYACCRQGAQIR